MNVARPGRWGNPYTIEEFGRELALELYGRSIQGFWSPDGIPCDKIEAAYKLHAEFRRRAHYFGMHADQLAGQNLACWCGLDERCHADILLELANGS